MAEQLKKKCDAALKEEGNSKEYYAPIRKLKEMVERDDVMIKKIAEDVK